MATRRPFIAANWKMFKTRAQAKAFADTFKPLAPKPDRATVVVCPPFTALDTLTAAFAGSPVKVGAQDAYWEAEGAFTGEVAPGMLKEAGCAYVIVGHSERRKLFGDTDAVVNKKTRAVLKEGLTPIFCVGEQLADRDAGRTEQVVWAQLTHGLEGFGADLLKAIVIAYEPVWAIGTGRTATPEQAQDVHAFIRAWVAKTAPGVDATLPILYGGSVKPDNIAQLMKGPDIDGGLVGGAALDPNSFAGIVKGALEARP